MVTQGSENFINQRKLNLDGRLIVTAGGGGGGAERYTKWLQ